MKKYFDEGQSIIKITQLQVLSPFEHLILELNNDDNIIANGPWRVAEINILQSQKFYETRFCAAFLPIKQYYASRTSKFHISE